MPLYRYSLFSLVGTVWLSCVLSTAWANHPSNLAPAATETLPTEGAREVGAITEAPAPPPSRRVYHNDEALQGRATRQGSLNAPYERPFLVGASHVALGGYVEMLSTWTKNEGIVEGTQFSLPRFNLFVYARPLPRVEFLAELEFENGGQEIKIETAQLDVVLAQGLSLRAGVFLVPIGQWNMNHDAPKWPLPDRPLVVETIIPATHSEVGVGLHSEHTWGDWSLQGQAYISNGLGEGVLLNESGRVDIPSGKHEGILAFDANGRPAISGRLAVIHKDYVELGVSTYHAAYNRWRIDGEQVDRRRSVTLGALDVGFTLPRLEIQAEFVWAWIQVPVHAQALFAQRQWGWHTDVYIDLWRHAFRTGTDGRLRAAFRAEQADYFHGQFPTGQKAGDLTTGLTAGLAWQLGRQLTVRAALRQRWHRDILNNPATREVQLQVGAASYF